MRPPLIACALMLALPACSSLTGPTPAPSCDGGARRPLNRSLWDWEAARPVPVPVPLATAPVAAAPAEAVVPAPVPRPDPIVRKGEAEPDRPAASTRGLLPAAFDVAASLQPCDRERHHG